MDSFADIPDAQVPFSVSQDEEGQPIRHFSTDEVFLQARC